MLVIVDDQAVARQTMWLSLSFDHRRVEGTPATRFVQRVVQIISDRTCCWPDTLYRLEKENHARDTTSPMRVGSVAPSASPGT